MFNMKDFKDLLFISNQLTIRKIHKIENNE